MAMTNQSTTIGVFRDRSLAEQAIHDLKNAGFRDEQISLLGHNTGGAFSGLRDLFGRHAEQEQMTNEANQNENQPSELPQELSGVPLDQAPFYQQELNAGHSLVVVRSDGQQQQAHDILYRHGAYDAGAATSAGFTGATSSTRTVPIREERLDVNKHTVQVGEIRIHKRVITENRTITVPVRREEVYIERIPARGEDEALGNAVNAQGIEFNRGVASLGTTSQSAAPTYVDPTNTAVSQGTMPQSTLDTANTGNPLARLFHRDNAETPTQDATDTVAQDQPLEGEILHEGGMIRILVREERVTINKEPFVIEEIRIRKQPVQETRTIDETVRHEEAHLERAGDFEVHGDGVENVVNP